MSDCRYTVECAEVTITVGDFLRNGVNVPKFLECCKACKNYGKRWACPPFDFDPIALWERHKTLRLIARILLPKGCTGSELLAALKREKKIFLDELLELERTTEGSLALSCGSCDICDDCARSKGEDCVFPDRCRHSIEALGGDVAGIAERYFHKPLLWIKNDAVPEYMVLIGGLLLK